MKGGKLAKKTRKYLLKMHASCLNYITIMVGGKKGNEIYLRFTLSFSMSSKSSEVYLQHINMSHLTPKI